MTQQGYRYVTIQPHHGGFGMYDVHPNKGEDIYADTYDLISACDPAAYVSTEYEGWRDDEATELVRALEEVAGSCYNEPPILVALLTHQGEVVVFGIEPTTSPG